MYKSYTNNFLFKLSRKYYFSYPCPRKLREIVHMSLLEKEQPHKIKEIWKQYYEGKPHAIGIDIDGDEMKLIIEK
jgi:ATP synthase F1 complex assembly factor 1